MSNNTLNAALQRLGYSKEESRVTWKFASQG